MTTAIVEHNKNIDSKKFTKNLNKFNKDIFLKSFRDGLKPDEAITVSQFAEKYIYLPENMAMPGLISLDITPYFRKPLDDLTPYNGIKKIVVVGSVQIGKSNMGIIFGTSMMKISPGNTMFVLPRIGDAEDFSVERVTPIIKASPVLAKLIKMTGKSSDNKVSKKTYKGGFIYFVGAQSAASFRSKPIRFLYMDEVDEYPSDVEGQGHPVTLGENRTMSFKDNKKIVLTSTPTDENSLIWAEYLKGTQEQFYCPCPECGGFQTFDFYKGMKYKTVNDDNRTLIKGSVYYECEHCQHKITEAYKGGMTIQGEWRADEPNADFPSYRINTLYSNFAIWEEIVKKYLIALTDRKEMKTFVNTYLGEIYIEDQSELDSKKLFERAKEEGLPQMEIDPRIIVLTGAVDVQSDRLVVEIKGWGKNEESWTIWYKEYYGDLNNDEVWERVKNVVERPYAHPSGKDLNVRYCAMDSGGWFAQKVYDFCSRNPRFKAIKGSSHKQRMLLSAPRKKDVNYRGTYRKDGVELYMVGTEMAKEEIYSRLKIKESGPGYMNFNKDLDERFFEMLTAERHITKYVRGYPVKEWILPRNKKNEALDTNVYNYVIAKELIHIDELDEIGYEKAYIEMFGDYGRQFFNKLKTPEQLAQEELKKKMETIQQISKTQKQNGYMKQKNGGFMKKYKK